MGYFYAGTMFDNNITMSTRKNKSKIKGGKGGGKTRTGMARVPTSALPAYNPRKRVSKAARKSNKAIKRKKRY